MQGWIAITVALLSGVYIPNLFPERTALEYSAPFADDEECLKWRSFAKPPDRRRRIEIFAEAYGLADIGPVVGDVAAMQRTVAGFTRLLAQRGLQPQSSWVANGALDSQEQKARWTEDNRRLFERY